MPVRAKPIGPRIMVKQLDAHETTVSGIVLPAETGDLEQRGMVIAVGRWYQGWDSTDEIEEKPLPIYEGEIVIWRQGAGTKVKLDLDETGVHEDFLVLEMAEVLLVLEDVRPGVHA